MSKPLNENLTSVRVETEDGDLLPIMDVAGRSSANSSMLSIHTRRPAR